MKTTFAFITMLALTFGITKARAQPGAVVGGSAPAATVKPTLIGLLTMGNESWFDYTNELPTNKLLEANADPGVYSGAVIQATWSQLEPQPGVFDDTVISNALLQIQDYNQQYSSTPLVGKLRIFAGIHTPPWVFQQAGSVIVTNVNVFVLTNKFEVITNYSTNVYTLPDFWTTNYSSLWTQMQAHLASVFDTNPLLGEVAISVGSSITAEPFVVPGNFIQTLERGGYTVAQMELCLTNAANDYVAWKLTPLDYTFNTTFDGDSPGFSVEVMQAFRQGLGTRAVVANHNLDDPVPTNEVPDYIEFQTLYNAAVTAAPPVISPLEFQTAGPDVAWSTVIPFAISTYHPTEIEVWNTTNTTTNPNPSGGLAPVSLSQLQQWAARLKSSVFSPGFSTGGSFQMSYYCSLGSNYTLQASSDLKSWIPLFDFTCTNLPAILTDTAATNFAQRFYRLASPH
jgi:hypothetical protein